MTKRKKPARATKAALLLALLMALPAAPVADGACGGVRAGGDTPAATELAAGKKWCCCKGCCGYAYDCRYIPGCPRC